MTKQTGRNVSAGFGGQLSNLEEWVKSAEGVVKDALKVAKEASTCAALSGTTADLVKTGLTKIYQQLHSQEMTRVPQIQSANHVTMRTDSLQIP